MMHQYVEDVDATVARAEAAGATVLRTGGPVLRRPRRAGRGSLRPPVVVPRSRPRRQPRGDAGRHRGHGLTPAVHSAAEVRHARRIPAGWHPDPMSRYEFRYWDGTRWTEHVSRGGQTAVDPIEAAPVADATPTTTASPEHRGREASEAATSTSFPPAAQPQAVATAAAYKLCPHCRAQNATTADICPSCGKKYVVKKKWPWVVAAIFLLMVVGFVGCVAVVGTVAKKAVDDAERRAVAARDHARTVQCRQARIDARRGGQPTREAAPGCAAVRAAGFRGRHQLELHLLQPGRRIVRRSVPVLLREQRPAIQERVLTRRDWVSEYSLT